jgi:prolyl oligopeptidase
MKYRILYSFFFLLPGIELLAQNFDANVWKYPIIKQSTSIEYYFGKKLIDPYCQLEDLENTNVKSWLKAQNEFYDTIIHNISYHDTLKSEIKEMRKRQNTWESYPKISGSHVFYSFGFTDDNDVERLGYIDSSCNKPIEIFNTKKLNEKDFCTYNFNYYEPSFDAKYIAFGISPNGSEKANILIVDVEKKLLLADKIEHSVAGNIQWLPDNNGFFYIQDKELITVEDTNTPFEDSRVKLHIVGTDSRFDKEIFSRLINKDLNIRKDDWNLLFTFPSSDNVLMNVSSNLYSTIYIANLRNIIEQPAEKIAWKKICDVNEKITCNVLYGNKFFAMAFNNNPNGQLILIELPDTTRHVIYNAIGSSLDDMVLTKNLLFFTCIENGLNKMLMLNPENLALDSIKLPFSGGLYLKPSFSIVSYYQPSDNFWFSSTAYNHQWTLLLCDKNKNISTTEIYKDVRYLDTDLDLNVEETDVLSEDGVKIPLSIVYKKGIKFDGTNPAIIEAYGAFGYSIKPAFNRNRLMWFNRGGIYAFAHIRGGGEKGDAWYKGGFKSTKANSWKDLISCSEYLINKKYTSPKKLAVIGSSAGGIAVGRAITEHPELFKAAVIYMGLLNPVRFENSFNNACTSEFGTVKDSLEFGYLLNMDTYYHIQSGVSYPSILFTAGLNDSRLTAWQPAKAVAKFQEVSKGDNMVLFRIEDKGHFDYPSDADIYSFLFWQLDNPDFKLKPGGNIYKSNPK